VREIVDCDADHHTRNQNETRQFRYTLERGMTIHRGGELFEVLEELVRKGGLEPPCPCGRSHLKAVRLPISPLPLLNNCDALAFLAPQAKREGIAEFPTALCSSIRSIGGIAGFRRLSRNRCSSATVRVIQNTSVNSLRPTLQQPISQ
jgi:hypothetical protein